MVQKEPAPRSHPRLPHPCLHFKLTLPGPARGARLCSQALRWRVHRTSRQNTPTSSGQLDLDFESNSRQSAVKCNLLGDPGNSSLEEWPLIYRPSEPSPVWTNHCEPLSLHTLYTTIENTILDLRSLWKHQPRAPSALRDRR